MMHRLKIFMMAVAVACAPALADDGVDAEDLDFGSNLETPKVPQKVAPDIRMHMKDIKKAIAKHDVEVEMERDNEVVNIIIPCSELFAPNDTVIKTKGPGSDKLRLLNDLLRYPTMYKLVVAVYSDDTGEPEYCDWLTMARANAIYDFLVQMANTDNIKVIPYGLGAEDFRYANDSIEHRAANRRVEIFIIPEWQMIETARSGKL